MQLAKISNYPTYIVSYFNFSYITQMVFAGVFRNLIFDNLFVQNPAIYTNIENIVQHIVRQKCLCK